MRPPRANIPPDGAGERVSGSTRADAAVRNAPTSEALPRCALARAAFTSPSSLVRRAAGGGPPRARRAFRGWLGEGEAAHTGVACPGNREFSGEVTSLRAAACYHRVRMMVFRCTAHTCTPRRDPPLGIHLHPFPVFCPTCTAPHTHPLGHTLPLRGSCIASSSPNPPAAGPPDSHTRQPPTRDRRAPAARDALIEGHNEASQPNPPRPARPR
ncbi:hypothetical protein C2E23DRAFT_540037 [Lenzites betulinus]|nr:hypothetical protein C2E23DRAFT_540037 [Lenzites betulinus]